MDSANACGVGPFEMSVFFLTGVDSRLGDGCKHENYPGNPPGIRFEIGIRAFWNRQVSQKALRDQIFSQYSSGISMLIFNAPMAPQNSAS